MRSDVDAQVTIADHAIGSTSEASLYQDAVSKAAIDELMNDGFHPSCERMSRHYCSTANRFTILEERQYIWQLGSSRTQRRERLFNKLQHLSVADNSRLPVFGQKQGRKIVFKIGKTVVCETAWLEAMKVRQSGDMFQRLKANVENGDTHLEKSHRVANASRGEAAVSFLNNYANEYGDFPAINSRMQFLPELSKKEVYDNYINVCGDGAVKLGTFYSLWTKNCAKISCRKEHTGFKQCDTCYNLREMKKVPGLTDIQLRCLSFLHDKHQAQQKCERTYFAASQQLSHRGPGRLTIVIDGMDHQKTKIPRWHTSMPTPKMDKFPKLKQTVIGVKVYYWLGGAKTRLFFFELDDMLVKSANSTIECLNQTIERMKLEFDTAHEQFPPFLHVEADNGSDNKNRYVVAYLSDLVRREIFLQVSLCFLYVGQTHNEIDRVFGLVSKTLKANRCVSVEQFESVLGSVEQAECKTTVIRLRQLHDWKSYYEDHLKEVISGISIPHQFRFWKHGDHCLSQFRMRSSTEWYPGRPIALSDGTALDPAVETYLNGLPDEFLLSRMDVEIPDICRVPNEVATGSVSWLSTAPAGVPIMEGLNTRTRMRVTRDALLKYAKHPDELMITSVELGSLLSYIDQRLTDLASGKALVEPFIWPFIHQDVVALQRSTPSSRRQDEWNKMQQEAFDTFPVPYKEKLINLTIAQGPGATEKVVVRNKRKKKSKSKPAPQKKSTHRMRLRTVSAVDYRDDLRTANGDDDNSSVEDVDDEDGEEVEDVNEEFQEFEASSDSEQEDEDEDQEEDEDY